MRRDQYGECNDRGMPLADFQAGWCSRCMNPECTRSLHGKTRFDLRTETWFERLFEQPPTMPPTDPRYGVIAGQRFISIDTGRVPEVGSGWVDPNTLVEPVTMPEPVALSAPAIMPVVISPAGGPDVLRNAPDQSGKVLPGAPARLLPAQAPVVTDPWATAEKVVPLGGTVRFGKGSGV
jgi:hypothetical protein